jgi:hypothetical protein
MEFSLKTTQHLKMHDIFSMDGQMAQVIGYAGDYTICEYIDHDDQAELTDLDMDAITEFNTDESN